jgi:hypothetical protein
MATDADTKLVPCWHVGNRDGAAAMEFIDDLASLWLNSPFSSHVRSEISKRSLGFTQWTLDNVGVLPKRV